jgi:serine/threonine-protein kinase
VGTTPHREDRDEGSELDETEVDVTLVEPYEEARTPPSELTALGRFGRYELLGRMAVGGMAEIFLARERGAGGGTRQVVVKVLRPELEHDRELQSLFLQEGHVALRLKHPNLCHAYEVGIERERCFIAMEHVHGLTLRRLLRTAARCGERVPVPMLVRIAADVAAALHAAHHARDASGRPLGIVHRDVSPHNVMIGFDGVVKLLDFGVAHAETELRPREAPGLVRGKLGYLAPEQCVGHPVDARTDVFALGVCLWEGLASRRLYKRNDSYETMQAIVSEDPPSPAHWNTPVPDALAMIVRRALDRAPDLRFPSAGAFQDALEQYLVQRGERVSSAQLAAYLASFGVHAHRPELDRSEAAVRWLAAPGRAPSLASGSRRLVLLVGAAAAGMISAVALAAWSSTRPEPRAAEAPHAPTMEAPIAAPVASASPAAIEPVAQAPLDPAAPLACPMPESETTTRAHRRRPRPGGFVDDPGF